MREAGLCHLRCQYQSIRWGCRGRARNNMGGIKDGQENVQAEGQRGNTNKRYV
jgi:hypothetical protein